MRRLAFALALACLAPAAAPAQTPFRMVTLDSPANHIRTNSLLLGSFTGANPGWTEIEVEVFDSWWEYARFKESIVFSQGVASGSWGLNMAWTRPWSCGFNFPPIDPPAANLWYKVTMRSVEPGNEWEVSHETERYTLDTDPWEPAANLTSPSNAVPLAPSGTASGQYQELSELTVVFTRMDTVEEVAAIEAGFNGQTGRWTADYDLSGLGIPPGTEILIGLVGYNPYADPHWQALGAYSRTMGGN